MSPKKTAGADLTFSQAMEELEGVLGRIEGDEIDVDQLATELSRAAELLEVCRQKIRRAEVEVQQIVEQIEGDGVDSGEATTDPQAAPSGATEELDDDIPF